MTHFEKAIKLQQAFLQSHSKRKYYLDRATKSAIITVNEILSNMTETIPFMAESNEILGSKSYWMSVKSELLKLI